MKNESVQNINNFENILNTILEPQENFDLIKLKVDADVVLCEHMAKEFMSLSNLFSSFKGGV